MPRDVWLLFFVLLVNRAGTMVLPFLALYLTVERDLTVVEAGRLVGLYGIGSVIGSWSGGWLTDRVGSVATMRGSLIASGLGLLGFLLLETPAEIATGIFVVSVVSEAFRPALMTSVAERAPTVLQIRAFALVRLAANLGMAIGPAVGGLLAVYSYNLLFVGDGVTCLAAAVLLFVALPAKAAEEEDADDSVARGRRSPWLDPPFLLLLLLVFLYATVLFQVFGTLPLYLRQVHGHRENVIGLLLGFNAFLIVVFEMVLIHWAQGFARMRMIGIGAALTCAGMGLLPLGSSLPFLAFTITVWTVGEMLALPFFNAAVAARPSRSQRGRYMGAYNVAYSVAFIAAPVCGTWIYDHLGPDAVWYGVSGLAPLLLIWALSLSRQFDPRESA